MGRCTYLGSFRRLDEAYRAPGCSGSREGFGNGPAIGIDTVWLLVIDEPWADFITPAAVPLKADPDQLEVREREENVSEGVKG
jgi:hypothetical protein